MACMGVFFVRTLGLLLQANLSTGFGQKKDAPDRTHVSLMENAKQAVEAKKPVSAGRKVCDRIVV